MDKYHLTRKGGDDWRLQKEGSPRASRVFHDMTKEEAVRQTAQFARGRGADTSVVIHKTDGKIQEERTYPRSADPRRSPG